MSRGGFRIIRSDFYEQEPGDRIDWLDSFARKIEQIGNNPQTAVEAARSRDQQSMIDMISTIMNGRTNRPNSVEGVVQDMQERTGLVEYLRRVKAAENTAVPVKSGEEKSYELPESFSDVPEKLREDVRNYVTNLIETHHGNIHVPAIVESVIQTFRLRGITPKQVNDMSFEKYISDRIVDQKQKSPSSDEHNVNIGRGVGVDNNDIDSANLDMFEGLMPAKT